MSNLIYSLNATVPVFLVIVVGYVLKKIGWITPEFIKVANKINFKVTLPALLIQDMVNNNFMEKFELGYDSDITMFFRNMDACKSIPKR